MYITIALLKNCSSKHPEGRKNFKKSKTSISSRIQHLDWKDELNPHPEDHTIRTTVY